MSVGTSHDTAVFSVNATRLWWQQERSLRYPGATRLLVTCDSGGSNSARCRLWKDQLAEFIHRPRSMDFNGIDPQTQITGTCSA